ncbi:carbohydrate ABC transporter permease [Paraburkholderia dilworthii]|uniref:Maltose/maltodextrin transport system permease protein MalG n=1 Tax=Paraburkholderia dilworthii TaxID=948106 RepID=A0ABW9D303_9BURK
MNTTPLERPIVLRGVSRRTIRRINHRLRKLAVLVVALLWLSPVIWIALTAFKPKVDVFSLRLFFRPTLANFVAAIHEPYLLWDRLASSSIVAFLTLAIAIPISATAAYAFSRFRFPGGSLWSVGLLATQFLPPVIVIIPLFVLFRNLNLLDSYAGLVIANLSFVVPYAVWIMKGYFDTLPPDIEEAAQVDGASRLRAFWDVVLPLARPGIATATIFSFVISWNEFFYALILTRDRTVTLPVALMNARNEFGSEWEIIAMLGLFITAPMLIAARYIQRYFTKGLISGAVR